MSREEEFNAWESAVKHALKTLRFGSVELVVHDGRVIQIEKREKIRLQTSPIPYGKAS
jgi:hypothetical protein